jgi:anaerobic selenocysteine-containing dehydrogenase
MVAPYRIPAGCIATYFPEANVLVPRTVDPRSKTPAFKAVPVTVEPVGVVGDQVEGRRALAIVT